MIVFFLHGGDEEIARILVLAREMKKFNGKYAFITTEFKVKEEWAGKKWMKQYTLEEAFDAFIDFGTPSVSTATDDKLNKFQQNVRDRGSKKEVKFLM